MGCPALFAKNYNEKIHKPFQLNNKKETEKEQIPNDIIVNQIKPLDSDSHILREKDNGIEGKTKIETLKIILNENLPKPSKWVKIKFRILNTIKYF